MFLTKAARYSSLIQQHQSRQFSKILNAFATVDPNNLSEKSQGQNLVNGEWKNTIKQRVIIDPMTG